MVNCFKKCWEKCIINNDNKQKDPVFINLDYSNLETTNFVKLASNTVTKTITRTVTKNMKSMNK